MSDGAGDRRSTVIGLLGPVTVDGVAVPGVRARRLLASLALAGGRVCSADRLIADVWGEHPPGSPGPALHTQISRLRRHLGGADISGVAGGYRLDGAETDLDVVDRLTAAGAPGWAEEVDDLWRGTPGDDLGDDDTRLADEIARRARVLRTRIDRRRTREALAAGDHTTVRELAERRCAADPLDEDAHLQWMTALAAQGRRAEALAVFSALRRRLSRDLGIDPGAEITALHTRLLADEPSPGPGPGPGRRSVAVGLRAEATPLIGRDDDVAALARLLEDHRVVTVLGPGGIGKTRVANAVGLAAAASSSGPGPAVYFVPLASVRNDDDVAAAVAATLGVGETDLSGSGRLRTTISEVTAILAEAVAGRPTLIVLDNCEQVIDGVARLVDDLVAAASTLTVLTTSRAPLQIPAEQIHPLPVLASDGAAPAVELFLQRARAVRPTASLDRARVAELCGYLDGLPLAIELAAARVRTMSVTEITERLAERFTLLRSTDRTVPDRHRTLHAVIEWSWELLTPEARRLLTRLCRFPSGFGARAAVRVGGLAGVDLDDALTALVNQSLLQVIDDGDHVRYRMMEMVREFGEESLTADPDDAGSVDAAMAAWARELTADLRRRFDESVDRGMVESVAADVENLVWVLRRAMEADPVDADTVVHVFPILAAFWSVRGLHAEIAAWGDRILDVLRAPPDRLDEDARERWQLTVIAAGAPLLAQQAPRGLARARALLRRLHRPDLALSQPGDFLSALAVARTGVQRVRILELAPDRAAPDVRDLALGLRTNVRENSGNLIGAMRDSTRLAAADVRDPWVAAMNALSTGSLLGQQGRWREAVEHYRVAADGLDRMGATDDAVQARYFLAVVLITVGDLAEAEQILTSSSEIDPDRPLPEQGDPEAVAAQAMCWAALRSAQGRDGTELYAGAARTLLRELVPDRADPGANVILASAVCGVVLGGRADLAVPWTDDIARALHASLINPLWRDIPQLGSSALAVGLLLSCDPASDAADREDGAVLLATAARLGVRQDYPAVHEALRRRGEFVAVDAATGTAVARRTELSSRRRAMDAAAGLLARRLEAGQRASRM
ncbi:MAG: BTAD domain-containing putative transcriptional regulator [Gordonia sp. (in: high G+C Gram-positive bacteria)]|uniref:BTAD domain-containing putative transcriptional regulator n=1 Tax=Gordonia sp. (in: high G+C Gram-positive bacteria) TaxID=84139 RepID=UPI0039E4CB16